MKLKKEKILMLLIGNIRYDGRVQKEIKSLKELGIEVELIVTEFDSNDSLSNYDFPIKVVGKERGGNVIKQIVNNIKFYFKVRQLLSNNSALYVHCHDINALMYTFKIDSRKKIVYDSHELVLGNFSGKRLKILLKVEKYFVNRCYKIIQTQIDRLNLFYFHYKERVKYEDIVLIENWPLKIDNLSKTYFLDNYGYSDKKKILSYNGFIGEERNLEPVIQAMKNFDDVVFFIIGKGDKSYISRLVQLVKELRLEDKVFVKGPVVNSDVLHIANSSDLAVCFYSETKINSYFCASNKIYEYLNCGVKVLTNDIGGVSRVIKTGANGYCIKKINEETITIGLRTLLLNDSNFKENYYWENQLDQFKEIYS